MFMRMIPVSKKYSGAHDMGRRGPYHTLVNAPEMQDPGADKFRRAFYSLSPDGTVKCRQMTWLNAGLYIGLAKLHSDIDVVITDNATSNLDKPRSIVVFGEMEGR